VLPFGDDDANRAISISCGDSFTLVLDENHQVWSFGKGTHGRLGHGNDLNMDEPKLIEGLPKISTISAGCRHGSAVSEAGELYSWGFNFYEQLGLGTDRDFDRPEKVKAFKTQKVVNVSCGYFHTAALAHN
jgi:hypothetical protein